MLKTIAHRLGQTGLCVCPGFIQSPAIARLLNDLGEIRTTGVFKKAGIGRGNGHAETTRVRQDETHWLDRRLASHAQKPLWRKLDLLQQTLNRNLFLGLTSFDGHYAAYSAGGYYERHIDSFQGGPNRVVSFVLYLNQNWQPEDGGCLRIYSKDSHQDIDPVGGTLVCFMSNETEHEV